MRYTPGSRPVAVTASGVAVLDEEVAPEVAEQVWTLVAGGRGIAGVLEALTGAHGTSLTSLPGFALVLLDHGAVRVAVRGGFAVEVEGEEAVTVSGAGITTWAERVIPGAGRITVVGASDAVGAASVPVLDGVVFADAVVWDAAAAASGNATAGSAPAVAAAPAAESPGEPAASAERPPSADDMPAPASAASEAPSPEPAASTAPAPGAAPVPGLIDQAAVASFADIDTLLPTDSTYAPAAASAPAAEPRVDGDHAPDPFAATPGYEPMWDATIARPGEPGSPPADDGPGDHDGATISVAQARALREAAQSSVPPLAPPRRPAPARVRLSTGQTVLLDRTVVIGRRPRSTRVTGTDLPHLVAVDSPQQDISRSHLELRVEGDSVVATDLRTTNGTTLHRAGSDPVRLHPGEGTVVVTGDLLDLGDGITVVIEDAR